jgi:hypothetical protein
MPRFVSGDVQGGGDAVALTDVLLRDGRGRGGTGDAEEQCQPGGEHGEHGERVTRARGHDVMLPKQASSVILTRDPHEP